MTAIIVTLAAQPAAEAVAGPQWSVPLSSSGDYPATHMGCNWVGVPAAITDALAEIEGVEMGPVWSDLLTQLGLIRITTDWGEI